MKKFAKISLAVVMSMGLFACTDYVENYESDYKEAYGDEEVFKANLDKMDWEWAATCEKGDWLWCAVKDSKYMSEASNGSSWENFAEGSVQLTFACLNDKGLDCSRDILPKDKDLSSIIRKSGGIAFKVDEASGDFEAGIQIKADLASYSQVITAYANEFSGAYLSLRDVNSSGEVVSEWRWELSKGGVELHTYAYADLEYVKGESDLSTFIASANTVAFVLTQNASVTTGINVFAIGLGGAPYGQSVSSSVDGGTAKSSSSSKPKSSSSAKSSSSRTTVNTKLGECYPEKTSITVGESVVWKYYYGKDNYFYDDGGLGQATFEWTFVNGTPSTGGIASVSKFNAESKQVTYSSAGKKTAKLTITSQHYTGTLTCSTLEVLNSSESQSSSSMDESSSSQETFLWKGASRDDTVYTGFGSGGPWKSVTTDGTIIYRPTENMYDVCEGRCGFIVGAGKWSAREYFELDERKDATYDVSAWKGFCITYSSNADFKIMISPESADGFALFGMLPQVRVRKSSSVKVVNVLWNQFLRGDFMSMNQSVSDYVTALHSVVFEFSVTEGEKQFFNIYQVGSYEECSENGIAANIDASYFDDIVPKTTWDYLNPKIAYDTIIDSRDEQVYKTVKIGEQTWMAQNLNYQPKGDTTSYCYNNETAKCDLYGRLYTWDAAKEVCPDGWHLPSYTEWENLFVTVAGGSETGKMLKSLSGWNELDGNSGDGTDAFGFSALPAGIRNDGGGYERGGDYAHFWSTAEYNENYAYAMSVNYNDTEASLYYDGKVLGFSVRCVKTETASNSSSSSAILSSSSSEFEMDPERLAISLDSLVGFVQVGPFSEASTVSLYELYDGRTLSTTGKKFTTYTTNNGGRYKFPERTLESQYVMLTAEGKYRNLVTGEETGSEITLTSLSDIRKRSSVNINMLTYLEYERVYHLVTVGDQMGQKLTVKNAKRQALREILEQFHIELAGNYDAEDMDLFGTEDADAALIAVTILLQGDRSVSQLVALLTQITIDLADDGEWADSAKKVEIAKWAATQDLTQIRARLESWGGGSVPDFEKYIDNFVWQYMPAWQFLNPEKNYGVFVDDRDGQIYKTIKIGEQTWMAQNLNYAPKSDTVSRCYDDDPDSCAVYGRLYDSAAAVKVCPAGMHLPLKSDFESLVAATKVDTSVAGTKLKASERWIPSSAGTDDLGFSALPGGIWHAEFIWGGEETHFWALENSGSTSATYAMFLNSYTYAKIIKYSGDYMFSVRCVED